MKKFSAYKVQFKKPQQIYSITKDLDFIQLLKELNYNANFK